jgi:hypothetical protein
MPGDSSPSFLDGSQYTNLGESNSPFFGGIAVQVFKCTIIYRNPASCFPVKNIRVLYIFLPLKLPV